MGCKFGEFVTEYSFFLCILYNNLVKRMVKVRALSCMLNNDMYTCFDTTIPFLEREKRKERRAKIKLPGQVQLDC